MDKLTSNLYNLQRIINEQLQFKIPRYQRLFVWKDEQIKTLFNDILAASENKNELYYLGGVIIVKRTDDQASYDLVDGQQRFTTLWLLSNELGKEIDKINSFTSCNGQPRLKFAIRKNVEHYFNDLMGYVRLDSHSSDFEDLVRIDKARRTLSQLISEELSTIEAKTSFVDFLINNVKMVVTYVPQETDLNKLFETLNNRGEQLAQHEILKARILALFDSREERHRYSRLWNACSDMYNYFERSLAFEIGSAKEVASTYDFTKYNWRKIHATIGNQRNDSSDQLSLKQIISSQIKNVQKEEIDVDTRFFHPEADDEEFQKVRSILTFPQFLLHTLRIYLFKKGETDIKRINEKELLTIFSQHLLDLNHIIDRNAAKEHCKSFLDLLFKTREVFDKYIIKWVELDANNEVHLIKRVRKQNQKKGGWTYYLRREKTNQYDGMVLLQALLYHSQQNTTQYWLTPFLNRLLEHPTHEVAFIQLKHLDNVLFSTLKDDELLTERTWECMDGYPNVLPSTNLLTQELSTDFPHYWFYKIDFVLWHEREHLGKSEWKSYNMIAKNSIEHISPQNPEDISHKVCDYYTHRMGNLVLVTRSINSEYGDQPFGLKRARFKEKKRKGNYDSLKSDLIYDHEIWNDKLAKAHQDKIIELMELYFKKTMPYG